VVSEGFDMNFRFYRASRLNRHIMTRWRKAKGVPEKS
jgi:hypothetical protein